MIVAGRPSTITMKELKQGQSVWEQPNTQQYVQRIEFAGDGETFYTVGHRPQPTGHLGVLTQWSSKSGDEIKAVSSSEIYSCVGISPEGTRIVTGGITGRMCVFDQNLQQVNLVDVGGRGGIHAFRMMDEQHVLVGTYKGSVLMVDVNSSQELARLEPLPEHRLMPVRCIDYAPQQRRAVAVGGYDNAETIRIYRLDAPPNGE